jgi:hypothetical protein
MTLMFAISTDRNDWTWTPKAYRATYSWGWQWLCFEVRVAR